MEVIVDQQFLPTKSEHIGVDLPYLQVRSQFSGTTLGLGQCASLLDLIQLAAGLYGQSGECESAIKIRPHGLVSLRRARIQLRPHRFPDERKNAKPVLTRVLAVR